MRRCKDCNGVWFSEATWCIHCDSKNIEEVKKDAFQKLNEGEKK